MPTSFLRLYGPLLPRALARLYNAGLDVGFWPTGFKAASVVVIPKPGKQRELASRWRPISLLSYLGKPLEKILAGRLANATEAHNLLPPEQFGNHPNRSCEAAVKLVEHCVYAAWEAKGTASLLILDLQGAFDRVHYGWLVHTLCEAGLLPKFVSWVQG